MKERLCAIAVIGLVVFSRLLNAGTIFPIKFNADGTQDDPLISLWRAVRVKSGGVTRMIARWLKPGQCSTCGGGWGECPHL